MVPVFDGTPAQAHAPAQFTIADALRERAETQPPVQRRPQAAGRVLRLPNVEDRVRRFSGPAALRVTARREYVLEQ